MVNICCNLPVFSFRDKKLDLYPYILYNNLSVYVLKTGRIIKMKIMIRILNLDLSGLTSIKPNFDDPEYIMKGTSRV